MPVSPGGQRLAEFVDRLLARIIDSAILGGVMMVIILPIYLVGVFALVNNVESQTVISPSGRTTIEPTDPTAVMFQLLGLFALIMVLSLVLTYIYEVEMMWRHGQTIGKRIMKIQVVLLDPAARPIQQVADLPAEKSAPQEALRLTRWVAIKRVGTQFLCGFVPGLSLVDGLWQLWDKPYRQCLHDKAAATTVIKLNP